MIKSTVNTRVQENRSDLPIFKKLTNNPLFVEKGLKLFVLGYVVMFLPRIISLGEVPYFVLYTLELLGAILSFLGICLLTKFSTHPWKYPVLISSILYLFLTQDFSIFMRSITFWEDFYGTSFLIAGVLEAALGTVAIIGLSRIAHTIFSTTQNRADVDITYFLVALFVGPYLLLLLGLAHPSLTYIAKWFFLFYLLRLWQASHLLKGASPGSGNQLSLYLYLFFSFLLIKAAALGLLKFGLFSKTTFSANPYLFLALIGMLQVTIAAFLVKSSQQHDIKKPLKIFLVCLVAEWFVSSYLSYVLSGLTGNDIFSLGRALRYEDLFFYLSVLSQVLLTIGFWNLMSAFMKLAQGNDSIITQAGRAQKLAVLASIALLVFTSWRPHKHSHLSNMLLMGVTLSLSLILAYLVCRVFIGLIHHLATRYKEKIRTDDLEHLQNFSS